MKPAFKLRPWREEDLDDLVFQANNPGIAKYMMDGFPHPYDRVAGKRFLQMASSTKPVSIFAIEVDQKAVGGIGLHPQADIYSKNAELGYWLGEEFWGKGIITAAVKDMVTYGFANFDIRRIFARPFGSNLASQRVLEKAGFRKEATLKSTIFKNNAWEDELIYAVYR